MSPETASPSSNLPAGADAESTASGDQAAVETFRFEVSAGKQLSHANEHGRIAVLTDMPQHNAVTTAPRGRRRTTQQPVGHPTAHRVNSGRPAKRTIRTPAWLGSLLVNGGILVGMAMCTIAGLPEGFDFTLALSAEPAFTDEAVIEEFAVDPLEDFENVENQLVAEANTAVAASALSDGLLSADVASVSLADGALSDAAALFASGGGGLDEMMPSGERLTASFFGTEVEGRRILYVLDNSGGMQHGKLEALMEELLRSVESLSGEQEFYVIFYSDLLYPLYYPRPVERFVPVNDRFKQRLRVWLDSVEFCVGNSVDEAIRAAGAIRPDAVYLLTDGNVDTTRDGRKLAALTDGHGRGFPIHTFGIGMSENSKAAANLRLVADANRGTFRTVEVSEEAEARAKEKNRPYHDKEPGHVWGLNVGRGWGR